MTKDHPGPASHIHLDVLGGIAGDMFIAALVDARPDLLGPCIAAIRSAGLPESWIVEAQPATDKGMTGHRMRIEEDIPHAHAHGHPHSHHHYSDVRRTLEHSNLEKPVLARALDLVHLIAVTEAQVHGVDVEEVALHEVGDLDSLCDMVGAAYLIEALSPCTWSCSPLPLGGGFIEAAHGRMPVPAPATQLLLEGFRFVDDGVSGERITPTGAAILKYLNPESRLPVGRAVSRETGQGFGTRQLEGMANMLRARFYDRETSLAVMAEQVVVLEFIIDDQTPEDLAIGLENLRSHDQVLEVLQIPAIAKKGRMGHIVQVMTKPESREQVTEACFLETTTLGMRWRLEQRTVLERQTLQSSTGIGLKTAVRPNGMLSTKAEADDVAKRGGGHYEREHLRREAEAEPDSKERNE